MKSSWTYLTAVQKVGTALLTKMAGSKMKRNLLLLAIIALIFVMTVAFSACTSKDIPMPDNTTKSTSTESVSSVGQASDGSAVDSNVESMSQSSSKQGNGLTDGGNFEVSAHY